MGNGRQMPSRVLRASAWRTGRLT